MTPLLRVESLGCRFGSVRALQDVSLSIPAGTIVGLIGPNGAGKTTFFNAITGITPATSGTITWKGEDITRWPVERRAARGIIRTFQHARAFPRLTVRENLLAATHRIRASAPPAHLDAILARTGLARVAGVIARDLQYADMRRLSIAIAWAAGPDLLCLDEPAAGLGAREATALMDLIRQIAGEGVTICLVEHDMRFVMGLSEHVVVLDAGVKIAEGRPEVVQRDRKVIDVYLGTGQLGGSHAGRH